MLNHKNIKCYFTSHSIYLICMKYKTFFTFQRMILNSILAYMSEEGSLPLEQGRTGFEIWLSYLRGCHLRKKWIHFPNSVIGEMGFIKVVLL